MYLQEWSKSQSPDCNSLGSGHADVKVSQKGCTPRVLPNDVQVIEENEEPVGQGICKTSKKDFLPEEKEKAAKIKISLRTLRRSQSVPQPPDNSSAKRGNRLLRTPMESRQAYCREELTPIYTSKGTVATGREAERTLYQVTVVGVGTSR